MTAKLSKAAESALVNTTPRQGARVPGVEVRGADALHFEMRDFGLIGKDGGLTRRGLIVRERIVSDRMDEAF